MLRLAVTAIRQTLDDGRGRLPASADDCGVATARVTAMNHWFTYPNIDPVAFRLGPLAVHWYGLSYLFGFICVFLWMNRPAGRRRLGLTTDQIQDFLVYALVGVLIGGRTFFVIADIITQPQPRRRTSRTRSTSSRSGTAGWRSTAR